MKKIVTNKRGLTIIELITTIVVGSIVTMILMQLLVLSVNARTQLELENRMLNESYYIAEQIRFNIELLEAQEVELITDNASITEIHIKHLYDFTTNAQNEIVPDFSNPVTDVLILDKVNEVITYNGTQLNEARIFITAGSTMELISIEPAVCDLAATACDQGILRLTLTISVQLNDGSLLAPQTYITTILI
jgi:prepilin-type N-terminal cleavage/methylation domain-containing protein